MVEGTVAPTQIKCILFRIPRSYFPENLMTEDEQESSTPYITRLYRFAEKKDRLMAGQ